MHSTASVITLVHGHFSYFAIFLGLDMICVSIFVVLLRPDCTCYSKVLWTWYIEFVLQK
jgi:hypothetical protein